MKTSSIMGIKKAVVAGSMVVTLFGVTAQPVFAAESFFQKVQNAITAPFEKLYLQLIPGDKSGKLVLKQMGLASQKLKSFDSTTTVNAEFLNGSTTVGSASFSAAGPTVMGEVWNPETYTQEQVITATLNLEDLNLDATANLKLIDGTTYLQLTQLPDMNGANLDGLLNTWVKFDPATTSATTTGSSADTAVSPQELAQMQEAFYKMINTSEVSTATVEKKDGGDVYVMTVTASKEAIAEYLNTIHQIENKELDGLSQADTAGMLANLGEIKATLWVDKASFYPRHFELPLVINTSNLMDTQAAEINPTIAAVPVESLTEVRVNIVSDMSKYNQSFTITAPEGAEDSQVFFTKVMGAFMPGLSGFMMPQGTDVMPTGGYRPPTVGTTELPAMTPEQRQALEQYEQMMGTSLPLPMNY